MDYKSFFDIPKDITYLNTPGNGLLPKKHHEWRRQYESIFFDSASDLRDQQPQFISKVKDAFGKLFNCPSERVYALPNFSFGLHSLLSGLPTGSKIVVLEGDYPSLNYPVKSRGFDFFSVKIDENLEANIYETIKQTKADVLMLSVVQYISGLKIDLSFIKQLKSDFPSLLIIGDATQFLGTEPFDFELSGFDAIGGSGYKWMMAGFGNGYLMLSAQMCANLFRKAREIERPTEAMWANKSILDTFFEPGHQDTLAHGTLLQSIYFLETLGLDSIGSYLKELTDYAYDKFAERNWLLPEILNRDICSALINVQIDKNLYPYLLENGIKCFPRGTGIRIGLHIYNTKEDIDKFVETVERKINIHAV